MPAPAFERSAFAWSPGSARTAVGLATAPLLRPRLAAAGRPGRTGLLHRLRALHLWGRGLPLHLLRRPRLLPLHLLRWRLALHLLRWSRLRALHLLRRRLPLHLLRRPCLLALRRLRSRFGTLLLRPR